MRDPKAKRGLMRTPLALFLAHCSLVSTLRDIAPLWRGMPIVIGLTVPREDDIFAYHESLMYVVDRKNTGNPFADMGYDTQLAVLETNKTKSKSHSGETVQFLRLYDRVVMVVSDDTEFPDEFRIAADTLRTVHPITAVHIRAAVRVCLKFDISLEEAAAFLDVPLDSIDLLLRKGRNIETSLDRLASLAALPVSASSNDPSPDLSTLHGLGEAGVWGRELADDLADWKRGSIEWKDVERGVLISGPPGTGKTTFAAALARTCNVQLIAASVAIWQSKGHLGEMLKAMRQSFADALSIKPSILFLDEIDAIGDRNTFSGNNAQYGREVVAALLECMDGTEKRDGVVVVGACNNPKLIDSALKRPGRFDRIITIPLPDFPARTGILKWHLAGSLAADDLQQVVKLTDGWTGASLEQLVRQARRTARRSRREISIEDLTSALPQRTPLSSQTRYRYAVHESGHVVVALETDFVDVASVSIASDTDNAMGSQDAGMTHFTSRGECQATYDHYLAIICRCLAGLAAEEIVFGTKSTSAGGVSGSDLHLATVAAAQLEASYGMGSSLGFVSSNDEEEILAVYRSQTDVRSRTDGLLAQQYKVAKEIIKRRRADLDALANALVDRGSLNSIEISNVTGRNGNSGRSRRPSPGATTVKSSNT